MGATRTLRAALIVVTVSSCNSERMMAPEALFATIPTPGGRAFAADDTITTWPNWMIPVQVLANDTGLVEVLTAIATTGFAVPYHHSFVNFTPAAIGRTVVGYTAADSARTISLGATLAVTVAPAPPPSDLKLTATSYTTPGRLYVVLTSHVIGGVGVPASGLRSDPLPSGLVFRSRQNDRCVADLPVGKVSCYRPGIAVGVPRVDTLTFKGSGLVKLGFRLSSPASDPVPANNRAVVTARIP